MTAPCGLGDDPAAPALARGLVANTAMPDSATVERFLHETFVGRQGTSLRDEERTKRDELVGLLALVARAVDQSSKKRPFLLVDAAAGKGYVGLAAAMLVLAPRGQPFELVTIERDPRRVADIERAAARLGVTVQARTADVSDADAYPEDASLVTALHACGPAADAVLCSAAARRARRIVVLPCCTSNAVEGVTAARAVHARLGLPRSAPIAQRLQHAIVDGRRMLSLEASGYHAEAMEIVPTSVTPYNVAIVGRRMNEPIRMARAQESLAALGRFADAPG